jgi:trk system potassium uptake protein TrkA
VTVKDTDAEALEMELGPESPALGKTLAELGMAQGAVIGGIVRDDGVRVPTGGTRLQAGDRVVVFAKSEAIDAVEKLLLA